MGLVALAASVLAFSHAMAQLDFTGVNLTGAEYGQGIYPGEPGTNYIYPTDAEVDYFMSKGMNTFRVPFSWERMQQTLSGPLNTAQLGYMDSLVNYATSKGAYVILDPHNFAAYLQAGDSTSSVIGATGSSVTTADFADLWSRLAAHYSGNSHVIFGLMNEPVGIDNGGGRPGGTTEAWLNSANSAISAIRTAGATNLILVPGNGYDGAWSWTQSDPSSNSNFYGTANSLVMNQIVDPGNNYAYEVHQYFDDNSSGSSTTITNNDPTIGVQRLTAFTNWLETNHVRGFLGEFGAGTDNTSLQTMTDTLTYLDANSSAWMGWTYWDAPPPGWNTSDPFSVTPNGSGDQPQMAVLQSYAAVPEPGTVWLAAAGISLFGAMRLARQLRNPEA
jgi:endoglucanase